MTALKPPGLLSFQRYGCLALVLAFIGLIIAAVFGLRHVFMGTAVPFRVVAAIFEKANPAIKITGISGSLSTGPSVKSITWGDDPANRSEMLDLRIKYNGYTNAKAQKRVVIEDAGVRKAHIDLADFGPITRSKSITTTSGGPSPDDSVPGGSATKKTEEPAVEAIEVKQVLIEDVLITNRNSAFRLSIPKISWTGFKATRTTVEAGEIVVESDRLTLHTVPGRTVPVGGESVTYQKTLTGTAQPLLHPAILQPIEFALDFTFLPEVKAPAFHFTTAEGKVEIETTADGGHAVHVRDLDLSAYFDARKLYGPEAADFPDHLVLEAVAAPEEGPRRIVSGSFRLGMTTFQIEPQEVAAADAEKVTLRAVWRTGAGEIRWALPLKDFPLECRPVFSSEPELPPKEILARVFAGKAYEALSAEEKQGVEARMRAYFSSGVP